MACDAGHMSTHSPFFAPQRCCRAVSEYQTGNIQNQTCVCDSEMKMDDDLPHMSNPAAPWTPVLQTDHALCITPDKSSTKCENLLGISTKNTIISFPIPDPSLCLTPKQLVSTVSRVPLNNDDMIPARPTVLKTDPLLTVTPEKPVPTLSKAKSSLRSVKNDAEVKQKLKCKVRFDIDNNVIANVNKDSEQTKSVGNKVYEPKLYGGMDKSDDIFYGSDDLPRNHVFAVIPSIKSRWPDQDLDLSLKGSAYDRSLETSSANIMKSDINPASESNKRGDGPVLTISDHDNTPNKYQVVVTREFQERPVITEYQYPFESTNKTSDTEHVFSRPEYHNSLKVYREMKEAGNLVPNVVTALNRHLKASEETVTEINEKASAKVNQRFSTNMYSGLVGLEAPIGDLCLQTEKQITLWARPTKYQSRKLTSQLSLERTWTSTWYTDGVLMGKVWRMVWCCWFVKTGTTYTMLDAGLAKTDWGQAADSGPDLMEFFNCDFEKEAPDLHMTDGSNLPEDIKIAPQHLAYDLYRHNQVWEATQ